MTVFDGKMQCLRKTALPSYLGRCHTRCVSQLSNKNSTPLDLSYDLHVSPSNTDTKTNSILFLHGLFGSKANNRTMSKVLARALNRPIYALDLRNHGASPHSSLHTYTSMAIDVEHFCTTHTLSKPAIIGHSMGAKVAMTVALRKQLSVSSLISVDNAPVDAALKSGFGKYLNGMKAVERARITKLTEADAIMQDYEQEVGIRQFLLANLVRDGNEMKWRIPVEILSTALDHMGDFPFNNPDEVRWEGRSLFVRGTKSKYVPDEVLPITGRFFPSFEVKDIDCGHWVISEKPEEFKNAVIEFLSPEE